MQEKPLRGGAASLMLYRGGVLFGVGSFVDEVHELVEVRRDDDFGATVALTAEVGVIVGNRVILTATAGCEE